MHGALGVAGGQAWLRSSAGVCAGWGAAVPTRMTDVG